MDFLKLKDVNLEPFIDESINAKVSLKHNLLFA